MLPNVLQIHLQSPIQVARLPQQFVVQILVNIVSWNRDNNDEIHATCENYSLSVYVDSSDACNDLVFQLGNTAVGTTLATTKTWSIKVQI